MTDPDKDRLREFIRWTDALLRSMEGALRAEAPEYVWKHSSYREFARKYNQIVTEIAKSVALPPIIDLFDLERMPGKGDTIAMQQKGIFESILANAAMLKSVLEARLGVVEDETASLRDFLAARLRSAIFDVPGSERDVQDAVESLLIGRGMQKGQDYDREVGRVKFSAKEFIPDFIVPSLGMAMEVKFLNRPERRREIIDEINADIVAYLKKYRQVLFLIYDLGHVRDEAEFRRDLEASGAINVIIVKH